LSVIVVKKQPMHIYMALCSVVQRSFRLGLLEYRIR